MNLERMVSCNPHKTMRLSMVCCLVFLFNMATIIPNVESDDGLEIAKKWAPRIVFHENERFFPMSVPEFLENTNRVIPKSTTVAETLPTGQESQPYYMFTKTDMERLIRNSTTWIHGHKFATKFPGEEEAKESVPLYAAVKTCSDPDHYIITYIAFYGYRLGKEMCQVKFGSFHVGMPYPKIVKWCLKHVGKKRRFNSRVGDFQAMTLEIKNQVPEKLVLTLHDLRATYLYNSTASRFDLDVVEKKGLMKLWYTPNTVQIVDDHPLIYSTKGSHSFYADAGGFYYGSFILTGIIDINGYGSSWETWNNLEAFYTNNPGEAPDWYYYEGRWGHSKQDCTSFYKYLGLSEICLLAEGPRGPVTKPLEIQC